MTTITIPTRDIRDEQPADLDETPSTVRPQTARWNPWPTPNGVVVTEAIIQVSRRKLAELRDAARIERMA